MKEDTIDSAEDIFGPSTKTEIDKYFKLGDGRAVRLTNLFEEKFEYARNRQQILHILKIFQMHAAIYATISQEQFLGGSHLLSL